ncbi:DUF6188 family protein [Paenarthrobacter nitroguajacolicus]|uniref:DUF6188 family protein n=1 Tax=Paenarthrobacter nitroguajacolicus TaxID=211146 RepID=UPI00351D1E3F
MVGGEEQEEEEEQPDVECAQGGRALHLEFPDGSIIDVLPDERYEAWTLAGPDGLLLVSLPGNGLALWSADPTSATQDGDQPSPTPV